MKKQSAGILLFRGRGSTLEVLLAHPGGPFWAKKDEGAWSIPKGEFTEEAPLDAARREFEEELGSPIDGTFLPLTPVRIPNGKMIHAFAVRGDFDPSTVRSNLFSMEWPPRSGKMAEFPEVDRAAWFPMDEARRRINPGQAPLLEELERVAEGR